MHPPHHAHLLAPSVRARTRGRIVGLGVLGSLLITLGSWGSGAHPRRFGTLENLGLGWITFGHGLVVFSLLLWAGVFCLIAAWVVLGRRYILPPPGQDLAPGSARLTQRALVRIVALWSAPLVLAVPLFSRDVYSYLAQGLMRAANVDPYLEGPIAVENRLFWEVSGDWRNTTTPYGPLHIAAMRAITALTGDNVVPGIIATRLLMLLGFAGIVWALPHLARALNRDATFALWLGGANPLVLFHLIGGIHNEAIMMALTTIGLLLTLRRRLFLGAMLIAGAVAIKATAALALPFIVWIYLAQRREEAAAPAPPEGMPTSPSPLFTSRARLGSDLMTVLRVAVPTAVVALGTFFAITFAVGGSLGWVAALSGSNKVINWLALPTLAAHIIAVVGGLFGRVEFSQTLETTRAVSSVIMTLTIAWAVWWGRRSVRAAVWGLAGALLALSTLNALVLPWYYTCPLIIAAVIVASRRAAALIAAASVWASVIIAPDGGISIYYLQWVVIASVAAWATYRYLTLPAGARWLEILPGRWRRRQ